MKTLPLIVALIFIVISTEAFYLPGLAPVTYCEKEAEVVSEGKCRSKINLFVNRLNSEESVIPYEYKQ